MTLRFAILAHDDAEMLRILSRRLEPYPVSVHLDKDVNLSAYIASASGPMPPNVRFVDDRVSVNWGGYSVVKAMRSCAIDAMSGASDSEHIMFLSGHCYPLRPVEELVSHLNSSPKKQFARAYCLKDKDEWHTDRYALRHWFDLKYPKPPESLGRRVLRNGLKRLCMALPRRKTTLDIMAGSQWMALTAGCLKDALSALDSRPYNIFHNSFAPDEMAIQTFVYNSPWIQETQFGCPETLETADLSSLPNLHFLRPALAGLASLEDVQTAVKHRAFFIRKVNSDRSNGVVAYIDSLAAAAAKD